MIRKFAPLAVLLLTVACASAPMTSSSPSSSTPTAVPSGMASAEYVLLSSPTSVRVWDATDPEIGFHVRGAMTTRGFAPAGGVQGRGKLCTDGQDWLSFSDLKIHKASDGVTPSGSYLLGCASGTKFVPASREVVTQ